VSGFSFPGQWPLARGVALIRAEKGKKESLTPLLFEEIDNDLWNVYFGPLNLGRFNERDLTIEDALGRKSRKKLSPMSPD